jgi:endonuclease/exonuclease/phosphatase (EEP) superfamily protein YafD
MLLKTLQWNIGGGRLRGPDDDPTDARTYRHEQIEAVIQTIRQYEPDIITLQETHSDKRRSQTEQIATALNLPFYVSDVYADSHLEKGQGLGQAIIARHPMAEHSFALFLNPRLEATGVDGSHWKSHDKGVTSCRMRIADNIVLNVKTSHSVPYRKFNINPRASELRPLREDMAQKLLPEEDHYLYQGDLNHDDTSVKSFLPALFESGIEEVLANDPTTPKGRRYDHVLYKGIQHIRSVVGPNVLTDHFPVYSEFEIS